MADLRKVKFCPIDSDSYNGWINFDRVLYIEDQGVIDDEHVALAIMDHTSLASETVFRIQVQKSWTFERER